MDGKAAREGSGQSRSIGEPLWRQEKKPMSQASTECMHGPEELKVELQWIKLGGIFGLAAIAVYAALVAIPLPDAASVFFAASFGPLFSLASYGLYRLLVLNRNSVSLQIAPVSNAIAGALVTAMLLVQLSV